MSTYPSIKFSDGNSAPGIAWGLGTAWFGKTGPDGVNRDLVEALKTALKAGYTHIDNAEGYKNEKSFGAALKESGVDRSKLFITSKVGLGPGKGMPDIRGSIETQLKETGLDYLDLYLIHYPTDFGQPGNPASAEEAWKIMEKIKEDGLSKSIGVSNFRRADLAKILAGAKYPPVINQIELHPYIYNQAEGLLAYMKEHDIKIAAYGPTVPITKVPGGPLDPVLEKIAKEKKVEPSQLLLKLASQLGALVVTTSGKDWRMKQQLEAGSIPDLTKAEIEEILQAGAKKTHRQFMQHMSSDAESHKKNPM